MARSHFHARLPLGAGDWGGGSGDGPSFVASLTEEAPWINHKSTLENPDGIPETGNPACYRINPLGTFVLEVWDSCEAVAVPQRPAAGGEDGGGDPLRLPVHHLLPGRLRRGHHQRLT